MHAAQINYYKFWSWWNLIISCNKIDLAKQSKVLTKAEPLPLNTSDIIPGPFIIIYKQHAVTVVFITTVPYTELVNGTTKHH